MSRTGTPAPEPEMAELLQPDVTEQQPDDLLADEKSEKPKQRRPRAPDTLTREAGKSLLPHSRVQKILKADKELIMVQREAAFLISRATEEFVHRIAEAAQRVAERERRTTVQAKDLVSSVRRADELAFLEELLPWLEPEATAPGRRKPRAEVERDSGRGTTKNTTLDQFVKKSTGEESPDEDDEGPQMNIVLNQDGTMSMVPVDEPS